MPDEEKMKCPDCGAEMNHHADKLVYDAAPDDATDASGVILEAHTCPNCGCSATREHGAASGE
jgi:ribosomal protein S27AE